jgi:hypothetical protein
MTDDRQPTATEHLRAQIERERAHGRFFDALSALAAEALQLLREVREREKRGR